MTQAEQDFIEQFSRTFLLEWCCQTLTAGHITDVSGGAATKAQREIAPRCLEFAQEKGWVGKSEPKKVLAKGFSTAAAFLKR